MDPMFGFPAVKESKAIEEANKRNRTQERRLSVQMTDLDSKLNAKTLKIVHQKNYAWDLLGVIHPPSPSKNAVCPSGLTNEEKAMYRNLRRTSSPSMSLEEFDKHLQDVKRKECEKRKYEIMRRHRRKSRQVDLLVGQTPIIDLQQTTNSTLLKHKNRMKDAFIRSESSDVRLKDENQDQGPLKSSKRRNSFILPVLTNGTSSSILMRRSSEHEMSLLTPRRSSTSLENSASSIMLRSSRHLSSGMDTESFSSTQRKSSGNLRDALDKGSSAAVIRRGSVASTPRHSGSNGYLHTPRINKKTVSSAETKDEMEEINHLIEGLQIRTL